MKILGISAYYHDAAAALLIDGEIIAAAEEERFTRIKHDQSFPVNAIRFCLDYTQLEMKDIDAVVFYDKPFLKFERLLETYIAFAPRGLASFLKSIPLWVNEKIFTKRNIYRSLATTGEFDRKKIALLFPEHHLSHAASAFYVSSFEEAAIIVLDGVGEWATASICYGKEKDITVIRQLNFPHSPGLLYSAVTYFCGFKVNSGEYKLMGLAPYGNVDSENHKRYYRLLKTVICQINEDGSIHLDQSFFQYATGTRMVNDRKWEALLGLKRRKGEDEKLTQDHCDLALAVQLIIEEILTKMAIEAKAMTGSRNLCIAGGVALNCVANGKLYASHLYENIYIPSLPHDAGGAAGAALAAHHIYFRAERSIQSSFDKLNGSLLGPAYTDSEIEKVLEENKVAFIKCANNEELTDKVAGLIADGNTVGWFQGRMEFGPRALGCRSILADPRDSSVQEKLNLQVKFRENFRPFAPAVLEEQANDLFEISHPSPYMMLVVPVRQLTEFPADYRSWNMSQKLGFKKSDLPAVTHVDGSARVQTVNKEMNELFRQLLQAFYIKTGCPVLVNTSFNVRGQPIVNTPEEALACFLASGIDYLAIGSFLLDKKSQHINHNGLGKILKPD